MKIRKKLGSIKVIKESYQGVNAKFLAFPLIFFFFSNEKIQFYGRKKKIVYVKGDSYFNKFQTKKTQIIFLSEFARIFIPSIFFSFSFPFLCPFLEKMAEIIRYIMAKEFLTS